MGTVPKPNPFGGSTGSRFAPPMDHGDRLKDYKNRLVLITPTDFIDDFETSIGRTQVILADVVVIDEKNPAASKEMSGTIIFGAALVPYLRRCMDKDQLAHGRYIQREPTERGKSGAWALQAPSHDETALVMRYLDSVQTNPFASQDSDAE